MSSSIQKILGVKINNISQKEILEKIELFLDSEKFHQITTTNAEFILKAQKDKEFRKVINKSDLSLADSVTIWYAFIRNLNFLKFRIAGIDLMQEILKMAEQKNISIFLVAKEGGLSTWEETRDAILKKFSKLDIEGINIDSKNSKFQIPNSKFRKKIVFCNFGAPEQDKFIYSLRQFNGKICLGMGVGGSFDFLTRKVNRAPRWMRALGFEWFYRLMRQPNRWKRIFNAVIVFPVRVIFKK